MPELDLTALKKAAESFKAALRLAKKIMSKPAGELEYYEAELARSGVIQHFEYTYELCWKTMRRYMEMDNPSSANYFTQRDMFRAAAQRGLIGDFALWVEFHNARNRTSHVYSQDVAEYVYGVAESFEDALVGFLAVMELRV